MKVVEKALLIAELEKVRDSTLPPRMGMSLEDSPYTLNEWLEDVWNAAFEAAIRIVRERP